MLTSASSQIEFYERKAKIFAQENTILQGENTQLRKMLREAQQFQIKYELLVKNSQTDIQKLKIANEKIIAAQKQEFVTTVMRQKEKKWKAEVIELEEKIKKQAYFEVNNLKNELKILNDKVLSYENRNEEIELNSYKMKRYEKQNQSLKQQLEQMKTSYERQKQQELSSLKTHLTSNFREKMANARKHYDQKVVYLEKKLTAFEIHLDNEQFQMPKLKTLQTTDIKQLLEQKSKKYEAQLQDLSNSLQQKNSEIKQLLEQKMETQNNQRKELFTQRQQIRQLENIIIYKQKQHQNELYNAIQRITATKDLQQEDLKKQIKQLRETLQRERSIWNQKVLNHDNEIQNLTKRFQQQKKKITEQKNQHKRKVSELSIRLKQAQGERQIGETQMLINSIKDLDAKEDQLVGYQNGIVFLQRQLKKCQIKLQERSRTINKLYKDINDIRSEMDHQLMEVKEKAKKDKRDLTDRIVALQTQNKMLNEQIRQRQREDKKRERDIFKQKTELEQKNAALKELVEEVQRDYKRVIEGKKGVESSYRQQRQRNLTNISDTGILKKQKWVELQKQKNDLHIIFREKQEQLKVIHEQELDEKLNVINKLKQDFEVTKKQNEILLADNKKFIEQLQTNQENNKFSQFNKKMASLNLEIALTQNIYESLIKAKSGYPHQEGLAQSIVGIDVKHGYHDSEQEPAQLTMSFCPDPNKYKKK